LDDRPVCERCDRQRSTDVHELKSRARGGSIVAEANCRALCRGCHDFITTNPSAAEAEGWSLPSWADDSTNLSNGALQ
jgi:5-methylcytosine-specific restriction endonuclease McrA